MNTPSHALIWELWRRNRAVFGLMVIVLVLGWGLSHHIENIAREESKLSARFIAVNEREPPPGAVQKMAWEDERNVALVELQAAHLHKQAWMGVLQNGGIGWLIISTLVILAGAASVEPNTLRGFTGIPPRRHVLPVTEWQLIQWPVILGVICLWANWLGWMQLVFRPEVITWVPESLSLFPFLPFLASAQVWFLAVVWGLPSFPKIRAILLTMGAFAMIWLGGNQLMSKGMPGWEHDMTIGGALLAIPVGLLLTWAGVRAERHGGWAEPGWFTSWREFVGRMRRPSGKFSGQFTAQVWLEWRGNIQLPFLVWCGWLAGALLWQLWNLRNDPNDFQPVNGAWLILLMSLQFWAVFTGLQLARDPAVRRMELGTFEATRPLRVTTLVSAKLVVGLAAWAFAWILLFTLQLGVQELYPDFIGRRLPTPLDRTTELAINIFASLNFIIGILPLSLTGRIPRFPRSLLPLMGFYAIAAAPVILAADLPWQRQHLLFALGIAAVLLKVIFASVGGAWGIATGALRGSYLAGAFLFWLLGIASLAMFTLPDLMTTVEDSILLIITVILAIPFTRLVWAPWALAMNRHR